MPAPRAGGTPGLRNGGAAAGGRSRPRSASPSRPQALAGVAPGASQVDNSSGFLGRRPHRRHPGVLQLPCVRVPPVLAAAARALLLESSLPGVEAQVPALRNYLWSRRVPVEPEELQRRARRLEERLLEDAGWASREL